MDKASIRGFGRGFGRYLAKPAVLLAALASLTLQGQAAAVARTVVAEPVATPFTYADLADFADPAELVLRAKIVKQSEVPIERAPGLRPGWVRLYIEAKATALLASRASIGESLRYLVDVPRTAKGRAPKLKGDSVILFGREVAGRPGELQLVGTGAQLPAGEVLEARLRPLLDALSAADVPPRITGIRDVLWVPGNLVGESETQLFLSTQGDEPALISVIRRPGMEPFWGVSWSELVDQAARPPARETIVWYRLACFLPARLPAATHLATDPVARDRAEQDYQLVRRDLGICPRTAGR